MMLCSKLKNCLCNIVTISQVVTKFNVTKSRLHCTTIKTQINLTRFGGADWAIILLNYPTFEVLFLIFSWTKNKRS